MTSRDGYVHLHVHGDNSLLDGAGKAGEYVDVVVEHGQTGLGISDHGTVSGVYELIRKARAAGITPVPGCEFYLAPQNPLGAKIQEPVFYGKGGVKGEYDVSANGSFTHQTIWAVNNEGLHNLFKLSTLSYDPDRFYSKPRIDFNLLAEHSEGLVVATGCPSSEISTRLLMGQDDKAYEYAGRLKEVFGDRLFAEIMDHDMSSSIERILLPKQMAMARKLSIPLLATNDAHYALQDHHTHHEEMLCSQSGARMSDATWDTGGPRFAFDGSQFFLKTAEQMAQIFPEEDYPGALSNTVRIAEMAQDLGLGFDPSLRPHAHIPAGYTEETYFLKLIEEGFQKRYGNAPREIQAEARARIANEHEVLYSSNFVGYMLTVWEYIMWTRQKFSTLATDGTVLALPVGPGRGSVGGSTIAYILEISEVDPIRHDLLFERFLSAGRGDTYEIVYDDGSRETIIVSEKKAVHDGGETADKYVHQLKVGDDVLITEPIASSEPIVEELPAPEPVPTAPASIARIRSERPLPSTVPVLGPIPMEELSDLTSIPF